MKFIAITLLLCASLFANAQFGGPTPLKLITERFLNTKTYVVLTGDKKFDENLATGFEAFWTLTEFEFIEENAVLDMKDTTISYAMPLQLTVTDQYSTREYIQYGIVLGGEEPLATRNIANIHFDNYAHENFINEAAYRAFNLPKLMHNYLQMRVDGEPITGATITRIRYTAAALYNQNATKIKDKTLLVDIKQLQSGPHNPYKKKTIFSKEKFEKFYDGKVKFVTTEELEEAINQQNPDYTFLLSINSFKKYIFVIDCESGDMWYNGYEIRGVGITAKDIKRLSKSVNGVPFVKLK